MDEKSNRAARGDSIVAGSIGVVVVGAVLGLLYNMAGLASNPPFGLSWIGVPPSENVYIFEPEVPSGTDPAGEVEYHDIDDPMAMFDLGDDPAASLPEIPDLPRPIQIQLPVVKEFFDATGALLIDAREPEEFEAGRIPGAVNVSFDMAISDPSFLEALETGNRPLIVYCGGGGCEVSINLAWELLQAGHTKVTYFEGGFPEWLEAGYPVEGVQE
jgi:rhodanese-related sulfurtransferase